MSSNNEKDETGNKDHKKNADKEQDSSSSKEKVMHLTTMLATKATAMQLTLKQVKSSPNKPANPAIAAMNECIATLQQNESTMKKAMLKDGTTIKTMQKFLINGSNLYLGAVKKHASMTALLEV